ncbi:ribosomal-protein-alanine N-acetyltransferase [Tistlia consotensis]|uniref:Ribosomal-protein-alanine N-acetyltransferase n=1 Tax=Tistlia consotensis USBA 355 TaxID=560819 RepID=A0A1Y6CH88_9PROT|nr:GNAT family N-acetyltransferase [Tistlia consotensis]SMF55727.1 ribosomal-protein-alanine N-acetyltransferase [Tistlia consotensis USBA 355]SNR89089.1 ribosomal-protein-alanine N-acetyltransferase [Tistlia consotensis]
MTGPMTGPNTGPEAAPFAPLAGSRLRLRCPEPGDAAALSALVTPSVSRWMASWPCPFTQALAESRIAAARSAGLERRGLRCLVEAGGTIAGWIEVERDRDDPAVGALGYWIGEAHQGRGYAREAAALLVPAAFAFLDLAVIEAGAQPENLGSFAVMRALGMRPAGERMVFAAARGREERCVFHALERPPAPASGTA